MNLKMHGATITLILMMATAPAWAHSPHDAGEESLRAKVRESGLIMYGQVVDIRYRNSEPTQEQPQGVPHTFVTYQVLEVLRGEAPDKQVTLRIPGGADGQGGVYMVSTAPVFARGQTDVLFIKGGEIGDCQLVECVEGRFRVHENQVMNGWGVPVVEAHKRLRIGGIPRFDLNVMEMPRPSFKALLQRPDMREFLERLRMESRLSLKELQARYHREAPMTTTVNVGNQIKAINKDSSEEPEATPMELYGKPLTPEIFFDAIRMWSQQVGDPQASVMLVQANERFTVPDPEVMALGVSQEFLSKISDEERYDIQKMEGLR